MGSSHWDRSKSTSGFTLIEVILVLVVIVIISGIALPNLSGSYGNAKLRSAASNIERLGDMQEEWQSCVNKIFPW